MSKWPMVPLGEVLTQYKEYIDALEPREYPKLSVKLYGKGVVLDSSADGSTLKMKKHQLAKPGQVILSEIWGKKGAIGFVPEEGDGALCTSHFFLFDVNTNQIAPKWLEYIFKGNYLEDQLNLEARGTTGYAAVRPKHLLAAELPLPPLSEQRKVVDWIDAVATRVEEADSETASAMERLDNLLMSAFYQIANHAPICLLEEVAPLTRRPAEIDSTTEYPGISTRSFGRGTFHNPPLVGSEITWQKPYEVKSGDILVSNIKAWEGSIAVVKPEDDGRFGSHRYLTFTPVNGIATPHFVCFYLLSPEGLHHVGEASPGSADRNRTTGSRAMQKIPVPVPPYKQQLWFDELHAKVDEAKQLNHEIRKLREALLPSILNQVFSTEVIDGKAKA